MTAPLLGLTAALGFGVAAVVLRRGLQYAPSLTATVISVTFTAVAIWTLVALTLPLDLLMTPRVFPFVIAGLFAPGLGRLFMFTGVRRIGVSRSSALTASAPLYAVTLAVLFLGERPSWGLVAGATCIVAGGVLLAWRERGDRSWRRADIVFPLMAALSFALRDNISRVGLRDFPQPLVAAAAAALTSVVVMWLVAAVTRPALRVSRRGLGYLAVAGVAEAAAYLAMWSALAAGPVSVVSPLVSANPIFTVILTALFLRDLERVTWRIALAAVVVVSGIVAVVRFGTA